MEKEPEVPVEVTSSISTLFPLDGHAWVLPPRQPIWPRRRGRLARGLVLPAPASHSLQMAPATRSLALLSLHVGRFPRGRGLDMAAPITTGLSVVDSKVTCPHVLDVPHDPTVHPVSPLTALASLC